MIQKYYAGLVVCLVILESFIPLKKRLIGDVLWKRK